MKPVRRLTFRQVALRAAAVLLPATLVVGGYFLYERSGSVQRGAIHEPAASVQSFVATNAVATQPDSVRHITLPDGTEVTLNKNATFAYNDHREGELHGEAYFKVAKDAGHPFVIHSDHLKVTVLGTEFNFHTSTEDGQSKLSLYEGIVELDHTTGTHKLDTAGNEFTLDHTTAQADIREFDTAERPEWLAAYEKRLGIWSIGEIFDMIEVRYGVKIINRDVIDTSSRYTFTLDGAGPVESIMHTLEITDDGFNYTIDGTIITLDKKQLK